jgi:hypothetical protein
MGLILEFRATPSERGMSAKELQAIGRVRGADPLQEQSTEQA